MRFMLCAALTALVAASACQEPAETSDAGAIIALERAALDRWGNGDPRGYLEIMALEVTYFDPNQDGRVVGLDAMSGLLLPLTGKIRIDRYEMVNPKVQRHGDVAILTFNLVSYQKHADGAEAPVVRWNSTETYGRVDGPWRIIHSHWSYVKPDLKRPLPDGV